MSDKSFLDRASEYAFSELERLGGDPGKLPIPLQTVAVIYSAQGVIDNGGFEYFFGQDFDFSPPYSFFSDAYRRIGAAEAADCIDKAAAMFPFENAHLLKDERAKFIDTLDASSKFVELGDRVCGDEAIWSALEAYARRHSEAFKLI